SAQRLSDGAERAADSGVAELSSGASDAATAAIVHVGQVEDAIAAAVELILVRAAAGGAGVDMERQVVSREAGQRRVVADQAGARLADEAARAHYRPGRAEEADAAAGEGGIGEGDPGRTQGSAGDPERAEGGSNRVAGGVGLGEADVVGAERSRE